MPGLHVHLSLAEEALDSSAIAAYFDRASPEARNAFLLGAIAPDMGYYAPNCARLSTLAHTARTADLARALLRFARTDAERAFACGWLTHFLADARVHPVVNRTAHASLLARGRGGAGANQLLAVHLRLELALDAYLLDRLGRNPDAGRWREGSTPDRLVLEAFETTYGEPLAPLRITKALRSMRRWAPTVVDASRAIGRAQRIARHLPLARPRTDASLLDPPPAAFLLEVKRALRRARADFEIHLITGLAGLPSIDLESGAITETAATAA